MATPTPITATPVVGIKRTYPHVTAIEDPMAQMSTRLLWDRVHDLTEQLTAAQATITTLVAGHNATQTAVTSAATAAKQALALAQRPGATAEGTGTGVGGPPTPEPPPGDGGAAEEGCAAAGATGHDTGGVLSAIRAGQIACGTGNEYAALKNPTADQATRDANQEQLLLRMIWHLQQAGFTAGRQKNPSGAISNDKLCVVVDGTLRAYDMFPGVDFTVALTTHMNEVTPANMIADAGIPD